MKISGINSNRLLLYVILIIYISISHIFLPAFKTRRHFSLFFARWSMFSFPPYKSINDITWDGGRSFFFRDYRKKAIQSGVSIQSIFVRFYHIRTIKMPQYLHEQIINFCKCQRFDIVLLKGSLFDHIIYKKQLEVLKRKPYKHIAIKQNEIK